MLAISLAKLCTNLLCEKPRHVSAWSCLLLHKVGSLSDNQTKKMVLASIFAFFTSQHTVMNASWIDVHSWMKCIASSKCTWTHSLGFPFCDRSTTKACAVLRNFVKKRKTTFLVLKSLCFAMANCLEFYLFLLLVTTCKAMLLMSTNIYVFTSVKNWAQAFVLFCVVFVWYLKQNVSFCLDDLWFQRTKRKEGVSFVCIPKFTFQTNLKHKLLCVLPLASCLN